MRHRVLITEPPGKSHTPWCVLWGSREERLSKTVQYQNGLDRAQILFFNTGFFFSGIDNVPTNVRPVSPSQLFKIVLNSHDFRENRLARPITSSSFLLCGTSSYSPGGSDWKKWGLLFGQDWSFAKGLHCNLWLINNKLPPPRGALTSSLSVITPPFLESTSAGRWHLPGRESLSPLSISREEVIFRYKFSLLPGAWFSESRSSWGCRKGDWQLTLSSAHCYTSQCPGLQG